MTMPRSSAVLIALVLFVAAPAAAQQEETYDYWRPQREMIRRGQQAIFMCNGLFTGNRSIEHVFAQELAFLPSPIGTPSGGDYVINETRKAVAIGTPDGVPVMRAAFREGIGCVILAPDQTFEDIDRLPKLTLAYPPGDPAAIAWPDGDLIADTSLPAGIDAAALQAVSDWAFDRESPEQVTLSLMVVHNGRNHPRTVCARDGHVHPDPHLVDGQEHRGHPHRHARRRREDASGRAARVRVAAPRARCGNRPSQRHHTAPRAQHVEWSRHRRQRWARVCDRVRHVVLGRRQFRCGVRCGRR